MNYFKFDIWKKINSDDSATRDKAEQQWLINTETYFHNFNLLKSKLPPNFISVYEMHSNFHDALMEHIYIEKNNVYIYLEKGDVEIIVKYTGVKCFDIDYSGQDIGFGLFGEGESCWGYDEFSVDSDGSFVQSILTDIGSEIKIKFENILAKVNRPSIVSKITCKLKRHTF